jgi:hypothetical protein
MSIVDACALADINRDTYYDWQTRYSGISDKFEKARLECKRANIQRVLGASKNNWTAAAWYLERCWPSEFASRARVEHSGPDGEAVKIALVSEAKKRAKKYDKPK